MISGESYTVHIGNNLDILPTLEDNSVDSIVTDPPYELGFMGKKWDSTGIAYNPDLWRECLRVLKPGGHLLSFGGSRTWHRIAVAIEDAGFEVRDSIAWLYGSGFPKSLDISKAIDKAAGAEREVIATGFAYGMSKGQATSGYRPADYESKQLSNVAITPEAEQWEGWGTALKPAFEPVIVARKPLIGTVAENVLTYGTGGLNIDGSRIGTGTGEKKVVSYPDIRGDNYQQGKESYSDRGTVEREVIDKGRWPANVILDEHTAALLDEQTDASRFFYVAKASKRDRNEGLEELPSQVTGSFDGNTDLDNARKIGADPSKPNQPRQNFHPTVKPTDLMRYLIKLVTPPNGIVLDPFTGSGSTGKAAILEGLRFIGIEMTEDYIPIIAGRLKHAETERNKGLF